MQAGCGGVEADIGGHRLLGEKPIEAGFIGDLMNEAACGEHLRKSDLKAGIFKLSDGREDLGRMPVGHGKCRGAPLAFEAVESQGPGTLRAIGAIGLMSGTSMDGIDVAMLAPTGRVSSNAAARCSSL